ncbi:hypothetical protein lerEdw1_003959 [Lerista edwardsae]|nr:hypothetical protein lerEdw1_003959 [Lerista edwardsae]
MLLLLREGLERESQRRLISLCWAVDIIQPRGACRILTLARGAKPSRKRHCVASQCPAKGLQGETDAAAALEADVTKRGETR